MYVYVCVSTLEAVVTSKKQDLRSNRSYNAEILPENALNPMETNGEWLLKQRFLPAECLIIVRLSFLHVCTEDNKNSNVFNPYSRAFSTI